MCFDFNSTEINVLEHILNIYSQNNPEKTGKKGKNKPPTGNFLINPFKNMNMKLQAILKILMENQVNPRSTVKDIDVDVERQITEELGINAELDEFSFLMKRSNKVKLLFTINYSVKSFKYSFNIADI